MKFTVVLAPEESGGYSVTCPAVQGAVSQGETLEDTLANIEEAILLCLETYREDGTELPAETPELIAKEIEERLQNRAEEGLPLIVETREIEVGAGVAA